MENDMFQFDPNKCYSMPAYFGGSSYNLIQISVPTVFHGRKDYVEGNFVLVIWENRTRPILLGREESGMPKIEADIEDIHNNNGHYSGVASYEGHTFLSMDVTDTVPITGDALASLQASASHLNQFGWRYINNVGGPGATISEPILYPQELLISEAFDASCFFKWFPLTIEESPFQSHIIQSLANLPVYEIKNSQFVKGKLVLRPSLGQLLE